MRVRIAAVLLMIFTVLYPPTAGRAQRVERFFLVSLPDISDKRYDSNSIEIPNSDLSRIQIFIPKPLSDQMDYGRIFVSLNGQSANRIIDKIGLPDGKRLDIDLKKIPGFLLRKGNNAIEVLAQLKDSDLYNSCVLSAPYVGRTAPISTGTEAFTGEKYALIIGISRYLYDVPKLKFADSDARSFREFLLSPQGGRFRAENIRLMENETATLPKIKEALDEYVRKLRPEDLLIFFMAGHGAPENGDSRNPRPPFYYITSDTRVRDIARTALPMTLLRDKLTKEARVKRVVSFIDTCHSGGFGGQDENQIGMRNLSNDLTNQYFETSLYSSEGLAVITSSDINEVSFESQHWDNHGVFTFYLLRGLKGEADFDSDRIVTAGELFGYIQEKVPKAVEDFYEQLGRSGVKIENFKGQHPRAAIANNDRLQLSAISVPEKPTAAPERSIDPDPGAKKPPRKRRP